METATQICSVELISKLNGIKQLEIEAILGRRVRKGSTEYMIKWKGHSRYVNNNNIHCVSGAIVIDKCFKLYVLYL